MRYFSDRAELSYGSDAKVSGTVQMKTVVAMAASQHFNEALDQRRRAKFAVARPIAMAAAKVLVDAEFCRSEGNVVHRLFRGPCVHFEVKVGIHSCAMMHWNWWAVEWW